EVGGDKLLLRVTKNALHGAVRGGFQSRVHGIFARGLVDENGEIHDADIGRGNAHGVPVEFAFQLGNDKMQRFSRAGGARNHVESSRASAAKALHLVIPELKGKLDGYAMRVPTPNVSVVDLTVFVDKPATKESVNAALKAAASGPMKGILSYTEEELVSADFKGNSNSSIVDA